jgi:hypothetical protein
MFNQFILDFYLQFVSDNLLPALRWLRKNDVPPLIKMSWFDCAKINWCSCSVCNKIKYECNLNDDPDCRLIPHLNVITSSSKQCEPYFAMWISKSNSENFCDSKECVDAIITEYKHLKKLYHDYLQQRA